MGKVIAKNVVDRKSGYLYYVDGKGNVCEAKMARGGRKKKAAKRKTAKRATGRKATRKRR
ncbi:MAG: hypothetical protein Q8P57_03270 [Candidatus Pacearchaeota archaeon]|nr:hypothetical protein [Candidatus Pacearchaeota archaeon]